MQAKLAEIRGLVESARSMPMSSSAVVNRAELLELLRQLQDAIDEATQESRHVLADREGVVQDGRKEAELIVHEAELERERLVSDTEVFRMAQAKAKSLLDETQAEAAELRAETDQYVDGRLANFEITLERTLEAVRRGRERLAGQSVLDTLTSDEADKIVLPEHLEDWD